MQQPPEILTKPLEQLSLSTEFLAFANQNGFDCIGDLMDIPLNELEEIPGFNKRILSEYINVLMQHGLDSTLDQ